MSDEVDCKLYLITTINSPCPWLCKLRLQLPFAQRLVISIRMALWGEMRKSCLPLSPPIPHPAYLARDKAFFWTPAIWGLSSVGRRQPPLLLCSFWPEHRLGTAESQEPLVSFLQFPEVASPVHGLSVHGPTSGEAEMSLSLQRKTVYL